jgi:quercetin dioxygenase-like cupin family protein
MSIRDLLPLYLLDALDDDEARLVARALDQDLALVDELEALRAASVQLSELVPALAPPPAIKVRLLASTESRFENFVARFTAMFDVTAARARQLLALIDDATAWQPGPGTGAALIHFTAGAALASADTGFVRLAPGASFAWHRHDGIERNLVLAGSADDTLYGSLVAGDEVVGQPGTEHEFVNRGDRDYLFAVAVWGVDFDVVRPT